MKKTKFNSFEPVKVTEEFFELRLVCDTDTIDVFSLIKYLNQTNNMVHGINETLNKGFNTGYTEVEIEVFALEHGSIRIPLKLKKYAASTLFVISTNIIGNVAADLISGNKEPIVIVTADSNVEADPSVFLENSQTKRSVGKIARMVAENDSISDLKITYEKPNDQNETMTISKRTLEKVADECECTDDDIIYQYPKTKLQIYGPILDNKPSAWRVRYNGNTISARMTDVDFLDEMTAKKIAFAPNDEIIADLEQIITEDEKGSHIKWYIRKVHSYPKYTRIIRNNQQQALKL